MTCFVKHIKSFENLINGMSLYRTLPLSSNILTPKTQLDKKHVIIFNNDCFGIISKVLRSVTKTGIYTTQRFVVVRKNFPLPLRSARLVFNQLKNATTCAAYFRVQVAGQISHRRCRASPGAQGALTFSLRNIS